MYPVDTARLMPANAHDFRWKGVPHNPIFFIAFLFAQQVRQRPLYDVVHRKSTLCASRPKAR